MFWHIWQSIWYIFGDSLWCPAGNTLIRCSRWRSGESTEQATRNGHPKLIRWSAKRYKLLCSETGHGSLDFRPSEVDSLSIHEDDSICRSYPVIPLWTVHLSKPSSPTCPAAAAWPARSASNQHPFESSQGVESFTMMILLELSFKHVEFTRFKL